MLSGTLVSDISPNGPTDPIAYYRRPLVGWLFRERINAGLRLLPASYYASALEVGYASGAVQLVLAAGVDALHGIDLDADPQPVARLLEAHGHRSELRAGDVMELPYADGSFELVVCFSVIEHLRGYRRALEEMARVLTPGGQLLLGMPRVGRSMEIGFRAIGFRGIEDHHVTTPRQVEATFEAAGLRVEAAARLTMPPRLPLGVPLYYNWLVRKRELST